MQMTAGIEFMQRGSGDSGCIVLLHGIGSNRHSFDRLCEFLPVDVKAIAWNAPGYGRSAPLTHRTPCPEHYAQKLHEWIRTLDVKRFVLLGHSLGSLIASAYARLYPDDISKLVLMACAQGHGMQPGGVLPAAAQQRLIDLKKLGPKGFARARAPGLLYQPDSHPVLVKSAVDAMAAISPAGYAQAVHMLATGNLTDVANELQVDSLAIVGTEDQITPPQDTLRCHQALKNHAAPGAVHRYVELPDAGHLVHQHYPKVVAKHIVEFAGWHWTGVEHPR